MFGFGCSHKRTSFPQTPRFGSKRAARSTYVVCLSCGKEFDYDWKAMKIGEPVRPGAPAQLQELPTGRKLLEHWLGELGSGGASRMLEALYQSHPKPLNNQQLGELAGISASSGTFSTYLSKLRTLELITGERGQIRISEELI